MKKRIIFLFIAICISIIGYSQNSNINYKAQLRNNLGELLSNQNVNLRFTILEGPSLTSVYRETHNVITNEQGIVLAYIGQGTVESGSYESVDWSLGQHALQVEVDSGTGYVDLGTHPFNAVPYALSALNGVEELNDLSDVIRETEIPSLYIGSGSGENATGSFNLGVGALTLSNTVQSRNTAIGYSVLNANTAGNDNVGVGSFVLSNNTTGDNNTAIGSSALNSNLTGTSNIAIGINALTLNESGNQNTAVGSYALSNSITSGGNTALGYRALRFNTIGGTNTAIGWSALTNNTTGVSNVGIGSVALFNNETGANNIAIGSNSMSQQLSGDTNVAIGFNAMSSKVSGASNVALGARAMESVTSGSFNTAIGFRAFDAESIGIRNVSVGALTLTDNDTGANNVAIGYQAMSSNTTGSSNVALGYNALSAKTSGNGNVALGNNALGSLVSGDNNIAIGDNAQVPIANLNNQIRMGNTNVFAAYIQVPWTVTSDISWKSNVREVPVGLSFVNQLKPVDYIRKNGDNVKRETGFIAQDVKALLEKFNYKDQGMLVTDDNGKLLLRYNDFIAIIVKALQEQQLIIESKEKSILTLKAEVETLNEKVESLFNIVKQASEIEAELNTVSQSH